MHPFCIKALCPLPFAIAPQTQHNTDIAQTVRSAMLTTKKQHPEPKDWAAFTLIGEAF